MSRVCVFLADGFEEVEALTVVDLLRRARIEVKTVSISDSLTLIGRSHIEVNADEMFKKDECEKADMLVLPGGMPGTAYLGQHKGLKKLLEKFAKEDKYLAAICAAPTVLAQYGILDGKRATCYPGMETQLAGAQVVTDQKVVTDGRVITSRGAGTAIPFSLELIRALEGAQVADEVKRGIVYTG